MLSTKTALKLLVVAVVLSDFTVSASSGKAPECQVVDNAVTPSPTLPNGQPTTGTDKSAVDGSSDTKQDNSDDSSTSGSDVSGSVSGGANGGVHGGVDGGANGNVHGGVGGKGNGVAGLDFSDLISGVIEKNRHLRGF